MVGFPQFTVAKFNWNAIMIVAPVALVTVIEHIGDVLAIGATAEKDFVKNPGLHRTLLGDGLATSVSAFFGGPANTTYSENTDVLALTKVYNPVVMRIAAITAIILAFIPKIGALIYSIPSSIMGGISILLFGMIASVGLKTLVDNKVDLNNGKNLIIVAVMLVLSIGGASLSIGNFSLEGIGLAVIVGLILNIFFILFKPKSE